MEDELTFFFDSYALIEIYQGNPRYEQYRKATVVTTYFQLYETYYALIRNGFSQEHVRDFFTFLQHLCINLKFSWIPNAVQFRRKYIKRDLSYADCLGYIAALEMDIPFLTGDKEFKDLPNVAFVKK